MQLIILEYHFALDFLCISMYFNTKQTTKQKIEEYFYAITV